MDKRNQMENPFFDPDKPGSIFVGMDRYHQYSPHQPRNALTFIQKGDADSLFRKFLIDNIKEAECCPYIPDTELLRFDLANMRQVPPVDTHTPFEEYISKELLPYFQDRENALYSFLNLLYIYLTPILSFHLINKIFIFHLQYYLSTFT